MDIKIVDYNKEFEFDINKMLNIQWNENFCHNKNIVGKVALANNEFAGVCYGYKEKDLFYLNTLCVCNKYQQCGIGTQLLKSFIDNVKHRFTLIGGVKVHLLDNDGPGSNLPRAKKMFEKLGFVFNKVIPNYFAKDNNFDYCSDCEHKPCICSAWEYVLTF